MTYIYIIYIYIHYLFDILFHRGPRDWIEFPVQYSRPRGLSIGNVCMYRPQPVLHVFTLLLRNLDQDDLGRTIQHLSCLGLWTYDPGWERTEVCVVRTLVTQFCA